MADRIESTNDARAGNSPVQHQYRVLSEEEKHMVAQVKDMGEAFVGALHAIGGTDPAGDRQASRDLALAQTHIEDAVMRAVRHITA